MSLVEGADLGSYWPVHQGGYDLSGAIYDYAAVAGLAAGMASVDFKSWRVGLGRWEISSELFAQVPGAGGGGTTCAAPPFPQQRSVHATLDDLLRERDFFQLTVDHGFAGVVDLADLDEPANYHFDYLDRVLAQATALGAEPYLDIDHMPRVLAAHTTLLVADCNNTFSNNVSTSPPYDNNVYAYAVIRVLQHVLDGWPNNSTRYPVRFVEIGNEPDAAANFWSGTQTQYQDMYIAVANALADVRASMPAESPWKQLRIGGGSFALAPGRAGIIGGNLVSSWVPGLLARLDATPATPLEFLSVHSYHDDGTEIVIDEFATRMELAQAAHGTRYAATELVLAEWGPDLSRLGDFAFNHGMSAVLTHAFGLAGAHALRFRMTHKAIFYDYLYDAGIGGFSTGLMDHAAQPSPNARVYQLFRDFMSTPRVIDFPALYPSGGAEGIIIAGIDAPGSTVQVLAVNAQPTERRLFVTTTGYAAFQPTTANAFVLDGDASAIRTESVAVSRAPGIQRVLPPRSVTLLRLH